MYWLRVVLAGFIIVTLPGCGGGDDQADESQTTTTVPAVAGPTPAELDAVCRSLALAMISDISGDMDEYQGKERGGDAVTDSKLVQTITALDAIDATDTDELADELKGAANPAATQAAQVAVSDWCRTHNWQL